MTRDIAKVGVVGLGTIGGGIVEVFARSGIAAIGVEVSDAALARAKSFIENSTQKAVDKEKMSADDRLRRRSAGSPIPSRWRISPSATW